MNVCVDHIRPAGFSLGKNPMGGGGQIAENCMKTKEFRKMAKNCMKTKEFRAFCGGGGLWSLWGEILGFFQLVGGDPPIPPILENPLPGICNKVSPSLTLQTIRHQAVNCFRGGNNFVTDMLDRFEDAWGSGIS